MPEGAQGVAIGIRMRFAALMLGGVMLGLPAAAAAQALPAGAPVELPLTASIPGVFEVELHDSGRVLYQLRVS